LFAVTEVDIAKGHQKWQRRAPPPGVEERDWSPEAGPSHVVYRGEFGFLGQTVS